MPSQRAAALVAASPAIAAAHFRAAADPFDPVTNPRGFLNLGTAEDQLMWDLLAPRVTAAPVMDAACTRYAPLHGTRALREAVADFLTRSLHSAIDADGVIVTAGASAALDVVASALCDPGEVILVPAPYYGALDVDLVGRSGARLVPVPARSDDGFALHPAAVDRAVTEARRRGLTVRALALTSPNNPVGQVYAPDVLRDLLAVAARHDLDVIADEIYANCVFDGSPFTSATTLTAGPLHAERVHLVWGFAKDFALPGFKAGVLYTRDPRVRAAARALAYFAPVSTHTQALLTDLLADRGWTDAFLAEHRRRLARSYRAAATVLDAHGIGYVPAQAGFSVWADLRPWLDQPSFAAEQALCRAILDECRVSVQPGKAFVSPEPGWFRVCHTSAPALVDEALHRVGAMLASLPQPAGAR